LIPRPVFTRAATAAAELGSMCTTFGSGL
jgi:hypothetical protein